VDPESAAFAEGRKDVSGPASEADVGYFDGGDDEVYHLDEGGCSSEWRG
jgi:hypothetical protein